ncbi:hypothetical protein [Streptomyces sp. NPDC059080]|uniref:hypothetical protein n=1 Tax=Streptomyces sp. NPDC059080 TaxID=3346718 RepID=UPI0036B590D3
MTRTKQRYGAAATLALAVLTLSGCDSNSDTSYESAYANHEPLHVVGYPSTGSLRLTQELVWHIADGETDDLRSLATSDSSDAQSKKTAENWIKGFEEGARGKVTADFYDEASERQVVVLYFHDTKQVKEFSLRVDGKSDEEKWQVLMKETDLKDAKQKPTWAPKEPGGTDSKSSS